MFRCPHCHQALYPNTLGYQCAFGHHFDRHRSGYLHLLAKPRKSRMGDDDEMIWARHHFLQSQQYAFLKDRLCEIMTSLQPKTLVDLGCGDGYYTNAFKAVVPTCEVYGFDLSKLALRLASKGAQVHYAIGSIADLPLMTHQTDLASALFVPHNYNELLRILKPKGHFILVAPGQNHLYELKQQLYEKVRLNPLPFIDERFKIMHQEQLDRTVFLTHDDYMHLFRMTPYFHTTAPKMHPQLNHDLRLSIRFSFIIYILQVSI